MNTDAALIPPGLIYVSDAAPGIRRLRHGRGFRYLGVEGVPLRDPARLSRIRRLAIPPAYEQVWICPCENGHLQATGRDARGRKQYLYHPHWRSVRDAAKFERMLEFGQVLGRIRARVDRDLASRDLGKQRITAAIVRLLDTTCMRVGNDEYARTNGSYGLTTLRNRHARVDGERVRLSFRGKSGILHQVELADPRVARLVRRCVELPGQELFQYVDTQGLAHGVGSSDVNAYLKQVTGSDFTAKDFRTWHATVDALELLLQCSAGSKTEARRLVNAALREVAARLGNTVAVCRKAYVHPAVIAHFSNGSLGRLLEAGGACARRLRGTARLPARERRVLLFLAAAADAAATGGATVSPAASRP